MSVLELISKGQGFVQTGVRLAVDLLSHWLPQILHIMRQHTTVNLTPIEVADQHPEEWTKYGITPQ
jgi:hypothetical protein